MRRGLGIVALAAVLMASRPSLAAEEVSPARTAAATAIVGKLDLERVVDTMLDNLKGLFSDNVVAIMERQDRTFFDTLPGGRERFSQILGEEFMISFRRQYPEMKEIAAREYASIFTEGELHDLHAFFSSGVGVKWLAASPQIETAMRKWGEAAGGEAGADALSSAMKRARAEQKNTQRKGS